MTDPREQIPLIDEEGMETLLNKVADKFDEIRGKLPYSLSSEEPDPEKVAIWMPLVGQLVGN